MSWSLIFIFLFTTNIHQHIVHQPHYCPPKIHHSSSCPITQYINSNFYRPLWFITWCSSKLWSWLQTAQPLNGYRSVTGIHSDLLLLHLRTKKISTITHKPICYTADSILTQEEAYRMNHYWITCYSINMISKICNLVKHGQSSCSTKIWSCTEDPGQLNQYTYSNLAMSRTTSVHQRFRGTVIFTVTALRGTNTARVWLPDQLWGPFSLLSNGYQNSYAW
jgi:hypothetical protein